jgi:hypothetical protein
MDKCLICGNKKLLTQPKPQTLKYKGFSHPIYYKILVCMNCYGEVVPRKAIEYYKYELDNFRAEIDSIKNYS